MAPVLGSVNGLARRPEPDLSHGAPRLLGPDGRPLRPSGDDRPAGGAWGMEFPAPYSWTFVARVTGGDNAFFHQAWDEAMRAGREQANSMLRDCWLRSLLDERRYAVSGLRWHLEVPDEKDPRQRRVKAGLTRLAQGVSDLPRIVHTLAKAVWYGRYGVFCRWARASVNDGGDRPARGWTVEDFYPVNGDKIGHQLDGTPYVLIDPSRESDLGPHASVISTSVSRALSLRGTWRERVVIHRNELEDADYFYADQAESVHGFGVRSAVYWMNFLRMKFLGDVTNFFERVGLGVTVWKYPRGDDEALRSVRAAAAQQSDRAHIFVPVDPDSNRDSGTGVERMEVPTAGAAALLGLVEYIDKAIERYVVGQSGSASAESAGAGIGNEAAHALLRDTKRAIVVHDAALMGQTLTGSDRHPGLLSVMKKYTYPWADFPVRWVFDVESSESEKKLQAVDKVVQLGIAVKAAEVRAAAGLSRPEEGDELVHPPAQATGMPGLPGAAPAGAGGDPLAALGMGGGEGEAGGEAGGEGEAAPAEEGGGGGGDFLDSLKQSRPGEVLRCLKSLSPEESLALAESLGDRPARGARLVLRRDARDALRYVWVRTRRVGTNKKGQPVFQWYNPARRETRRQHIRPGTKPLLGGAYQADDAVIADVLGAARGLLGAPGQVTQEMLWAFARQLLQLSPRELRSLAGQAGFADEGDLYDRAVALARAALDAEGDLPPPDPAAAVRAVFGVVHDWPRERTGAPKDPQELRDHLEAVIQTV